MKERNYKEIVKTVEGNFVWKKEKTRANQEIACCRSGNTGKKTGSKFVILGQ